ncbi:MarR family winged helix-turn-helix transcriptional regulator [Falsibacillus albus]|uniref:MarR family transcriptional regulator n=1 Tax=Falsibacillus albus TaxID=2478915 RepID=A0A3L7JZD2_9BACI|nr:MarR family winged helix-turn-helix transcriptional regulator [Falsibacillus albus]RLQ96238.1 MarR family transcriptional regulator [Falsibacillus albus]
MDYSNPNVQKAVKILKSFQEINKETIILTQKNAESLGINIQQLGILNTIAANKSLTQREITEALSISKSTVSVNIEKLVQMGHIVRSESEKDRREVILTLTAKGQTISKQSSQNAYSYRAMLAAMKNISDADISELLRIHGEILNQLKKFQI